jgi:hypothetical protein
MKKKVAEAKDEDGVEIEKHLIMLRELALEADVKHMKAQVDKDGDWLATVTHAGEVYTVHDWSRRAVIMRLEALLRQAAVLKKAQDIEREKMRRWNRGEPLRY